MPRSWRSACLVRRNPVLVAGGPRLRTAASDERVQAGERDRARPVSGRSASGALGTDTDCLTPANEATSDLAILDFIVVTTDVFPGRRLAGALRQTPGELP